MAEVAPELHMPPDPLPDQDAAAEGAAGSTVAIVGKFAKIASRPTRVPSRFLLAWSSMFVARMACITFLIAAALLYKGMSNSNVATYVSYVGPHAISMTRPSMYCYAAVAVAHGFDVARMVATFTGLADRFRTKTTLSMHVRDAASGIVHGRTRHFQTAWRLTLRAVYSSTGMLGINSPHFESINLAREVVQIIAQLTQVYMASVLLGRAWINTVYVACVVINCWSTPAIHWLMRGRPFSARVCSLIADAFMDASTGMILPMVLAIPYVLIVQPGLLPFDAVLVYNPVWNINYTLTARQVVARNAIDLAGKLFPHISIYLTLTTIQSKLPRRSARYLQSGKTESEVKGQQQASETTGRAARVIRLVNGGLVLAGAAILAIHAATNLRSRSALSTEMQGCKQPLNPWFVRLQACAVYQYSCAHQQTTTMSETSLDFLHAPSVQVLIVAHCPLLVMPAAFQNLHNLDYVAIFNSTVVSWNATAALTPTAHPLISKVQMIRCNMSRLPEALLVDTPTTLLAIQFGTTNLSSDSIPEDLDRYWDFFLGDLTIQSSHLTVIPDAFRRMRLSYVSLAGNRISKVPAWTFNMSMLNVGENPITELPPTLPGPPNPYLLRFGLMKTQLTTLPSYLYTLGVTGFTRVFVWETPYCKQLNLTQPQLMQQYGDTAKVTCTFENAYMRAPTLMYLTASLGK